MPGMSRHLHRYAPYWIALLAVLARVFPFPRTIDDAYITFRYAQNLLAGYGLVFNPGERVLGTTTPLYALLMGGLGLFTGGPDAPFPWLALGLNALADAITCLLLVRLGERLGSRLAGLAAAAVWAIAPFSVTFAIGGMETSIFVLLLTGLMLAYLEARLISAAILAALSLLTRPDALILLAPIVADYGVRWLRSQFARNRIQDTARRIHPPSLLYSPVLLPLTCFLLPLLAWTLFAIFYFGSPIPHSLAAKVAAYRLPPEAALGRLVQHYTTPFFEHHTFGTGWISAGLILYPFLFALGAARALRQQARAWPLFAYPWLYFAAFAIANPLIFRWYLTPPLPFYFLAIFLGLEKLLEDGLLLWMRVNMRGHRLGPYSRPNLPRTLQVIFLMPLLFSLREWTLHPDHGPDQPAPQMAWFKLELLYEQVGRDLAPDVTPQVVLAAGDVGALGYFSGGRILDTVGLNSPEAMGYYPLDPSLYVINYAIPPDLILDKRPAWVVFLEVYGREGLLKDPRFQTTYHLREKIPTDIYGSDGLLIFERLAATLHHAPNVHSANPASAAAEIGQPMRQPIGAYR